MNGNDGAAREKFGCGCEILDFRYDDDRQPALQPFREPVRGWLLREARRELRFEFVGVRQAFEAGGEVRHGEFGQAQHFAEAAPLRRRHHGGADPAVARTIDAERIGRREAADAGALLRLVADGGLRHLVFGQRHAGFVDAGVEPSPAVARPRHQPGAGGDEGPEPRDIARLEIRRLQRRAVGRADELRQARERAHGRIGRDMILVGPARAKPARVDHDQGAVGGNVRGRVARAEHQYVAGGEQRWQICLAFTREALAEIQEGECRAVLLACIAEQWRCAT